MSVTDELVKNAEAYAASFAKGDLPLPPAGRSRCSRAWTRG
jgi:carbonic anhydrase